MAHLKKTFQRAVAHLAEQSLSNTRALRSNPVIGNFYSSNKMLTKNE